MHPAEGRGPRAAIHGWKTGDDGTAGKWSPSQLAHDNPAKKSESLATTFDRLAKAAAAHDGEATGRMFRGMS